jgi:hypothetical protein
LFNEGLNGEKFALVIGIETYLDSGMNPVRHAEADAEGFTEAVRLHGFEAKNIQLLLSSAATKAVILSAMLCLLTREFNEQLKLYRL